MDLVFQEETPKYKNPCEPDCDCKPETYAVENSWRYCPECGLFAETCVQSTQGYIRRYCPTDNLNYQLRAIQGQVGKTVRSKFNSEYLDEIKMKCGGDYTLKNIHQAMRNNNDHRYCHYVLSLLTNQRLRLTVEDTERIKNLCGNCALSGEFKRLPVMHAIMVLANVFNLNYIKPFSFSPVKLSAQRYNRITDKI